jgi:hypothetical protein
LRACFLVSEAPLLPPAASCSRMYWRTCSNSEPPVDTAQPRAQKCSPEKFLSFPPVGRWQWRSSPRGGPCRVEHAPVSSAGPPCPNGPSRQSPFD